MHKIQIKECKSVSWKSLYSVKCFCIEYFLFLWCYNGTLKAIRLTKKITQGFWISSTQNEVVESSTQLDHMNSISEGDSGLCPCSQLLVGPWQRGCWVMGRGEPEH